MRRKLLSILVLTLFAISAIGITLVKSAAAEEERVAGSETTTERPCDHGEDAFCSHLPIIQIDTGGQRIRKEVVIWGTVSVFDEMDGSNHLEDKTRFETTATVKYRGNSSYFVFDKRSFRIKLYEDKDNPLDYRFLGMAADSEWVLNGPFLDRSLLRNYLMYDLSREILDWAPDTRFCEVFVDGEYQGVYLATEPVTNGPGRLNMYEAGLATGETAYLLSRERPGTETHVLQNFGTVRGFTSMELSVSYPSKKDVTSTQLEWIEKDVSAFEEVLYNAYFAHPEYGYAAYINVDSFVDYMLLNELAMITDASFLSTYTYKNILGKLKMTVWDFNNGVNNYPWQDNPVNQRFYLTTGNWFERLLQDRAFTTRVVQRYRELRAGLWQTDRLLGMIDDGVDLLGDAVSRNFEVWGYTFDERLLSRDEQGNDRDPHSYAEAVSMLKDTLVARLVFMDDNIETLYDFCIN